VTETFRMGLIDHKSPRARLIKVCFSSSTVAKSVLAEAPRLRHLPNCAKIYLRRSMPREERELLKKLREKCHQLNSQVPSDECVKYVLRDDKILRYVDCEILDDDKLGDVSVPLNG